jgi:HEPN domain-containing protein
MIHDATSSKQFNKFRALGKSWLSNAENFLSQSKEELKKHNYSNSVFSSIHCIEFSMKSIYLFYGFEPPKIHKVELEIENKKEDKKKPNLFKIAIENLEKILESGKLPSYITREEILKCFFYFKFWGEFYTLAKYGSLRLGIGAEELFGEKEAQLALDHAEKCSSLADYIKQHLNLY